MTGIAGGTVTGRDLTAVLDALHQEPWYERTVLEDGDVGLGMDHHGDRDPASALAVDGDEVTGVVYGAITNRDSLGFDGDDEALLEAVLDCPAEALVAFDGSFLLAVTDGDRILVATDKLGSRPCFYDDRDGFRFGSELDAVLVDRDPVFDERALGDMLLMGHLWGDRTVVEGVRALRPATVLTYDCDAGTTDRKRYWRPGYAAERPSEGYLDVLATDYEAAVGRVADTLPDRSALWLSGGLDSRSLVAALQPHLDLDDRLSAYGYDANPAGGGNPKLARDVADRVGVQFEQVPLTPDRFLDVVDESVRVTGGMIQWNSFLNLSAVFNVPDPMPGVIMEGAGQGEIIGNHLMQYHFDCGGDLVESLYRSEALTDVETVVRTLDADVNPLGSFKQTAEESTAPTFAGRVVDAHYQNYYGRFCLASDQLTRCRAETRIAYLDTAFLNHASKLPLDYRLDTFPFTDDKIQYGVTPAKLGLMRRLSSDLSRIPYERTKLPPTAPYPAHVAGFVVGTGLARLRSQTTYGGWGMPGRWYQLDDDFRGYVDGLLDDAKERDYFDGDALEGYRREHIEGERDRMHVIAPVTTLELWLQQHDL